MLEKKVIPAVFEDVWHLPVLAAESPIFTPAARGRKRRLCDVLLTSARGQKIRAYGEKLDESDADLWMALISASAAAGADQITQVPLARLLERVGRSDTPRNYFWLRRSIGALSVAAVSLSDGDARLILRLLNDVRLTQGDLHFSVDPRWFDLRPGRRPCIVDRAARLAIGPRGNETARALQRAMSASGDSVQRYSLKFLREFLNFTGGIGALRAALKKAVIELSRLEIIVGGRISGAGEDEQLVIWTGEDEPTEAAAQKDAADPERAPEGAGIDMQSGEDAKTGETPPAPAAAGNKVSADADVLRKFLIVLQGCEGKTREDGARAVDRVAFMRALRAAGLPSSIGAMKNLCEASEGQAEWIRAVVVLDHRAAPGS